MMPSENRFTLFGIMVYGVADFFRDMTDACA